VKEQAEMFPSPAQGQADHHAGVEIPDWFNLAAQKKLDLPSTWQWFSLQVVGREDVLIRGGVPIGHRRDGSPRWGPVRDCQTCVVTPAEHEAAKQEWKARTGKCAECYGTGWENIGWSQAEGRKYRRCRTCGADHSTTTDGTDG
jgi:hypothetical protein